MTYAEKLRSPKWQKKRLEILQRDDFTCQLCNDKESTLHVHHKEYRYGHEPWEYTDKNFVTYCEVCHMLMEQYKGVNFLSAYKSKSFRNEDIRIYASFEVTDRAVGCEDIIAIACFEYKPNENLIVFQNTFVKKSLDVFQKLFQQGELSIIQRNQ